MNFKLLNRVFAAVILAVSAIQFIVTAQPSVSFWDPGEISAAAYGLQVPHPPGGPLFSMVGHILFMIPFPGNIGYRINLLSVFSSAFSVFFTYLIIVRLIGLYKKSEPKDMMDAVVTYICAAIGALALSFCDTFWFNGVESNMFAASTFLVTLMVWLMLLWYENPDAPHSWRYFVLIAYLVGLSTGVHLMSVLVIVPVVMALVFKRYVVDDKLCRQTALIFLGHAVVLLAVAFTMWAGLTSTDPPTPEDFRKYDLDFILIMGSISVAIMAIFRKKVINKSSFYSGIAFGGIALYIVFSGIFKRLPALLTSVAGNSAGGGLAVLIAMMAALAYGIHWARVNGKLTLAVSGIGIILIVLGFTTYAEVIIRSSQHPPMNENNPSTFERLITYLGREQYGENPEFKRRWSNEPMHSPTWQNYSSDLDFFIRYQMGHMYVRYLVWNFGGRESVVQDAGVNWKQLYGIPLLIGIFGMYYHFKKDWQTASVFLALFVFLGVLIAFYPNAQEVQPRERDYFYAGSFFVFAIWIALGIRGAIDMIRERMSSPSQSGPAIGVVLVLAAVLVPGNMWKTNHISHDRSRNWLPWDFSYNLLQSCAKDAILITNGDNDTFPLWYLQDVEGVRRDIRIVNLSLVNTEWYIKELKNETPYGDAKIKMNLSDAQIDNLQPMQWKPQTITLPVPQDAITAYAVTDTSVLAHHSITFTMQPTLTFPEVRAIRVQDYMVREIVLHNTWQRPIYFANTCSPDCKIGLDDYLRIEGLAERLVPQKRTGGAAASGRYYINDTIMNANLLSDRSDWPATPSMGFRFRGLNDSTIFFDENQERMAQNYRGTYLILAAHYLYDEQNKDMGLKVLDRLSQVLPPNVIKSDYHSLYNIAAMYSDAGKPEKFKEFAPLIEKTGLARLDEIAPDAEEMNQVCSILAEVYSKTDENEKAAEILDRLTAKYPTDQNLKNEIARYRALAAQPKSK